MPQTMAATFVGMKRQLGDTGKICDVPAGISVHHSTVLCTLAEYSIPGQRTALHGSECEHVVPGSSYRNTTGTINDGIDSRSQTRARDGSSFLDGLKHGLG